ncbi:IS1182 family transposase [Planococcus lenghuensis]|uniref:Transposase n=1 Tax=Planococcus lenghuensis TaxID=2213202 RepID=A0A1Q2L0N1_9BACL|nr:IS1182 family transposase [Planococcus lenghuensis]AQQ53973.1 hypothetical protein B0X71_13295 [Planococcus lenghuensis]
MRNPTIASTDYTMQPALPSGKLLEHEIVVSTQGRRPAPAFKPYDPTQALSIPDIGALIPDHHVARVVDQLVEAYPEEVLTACYPGGGRPPFHPKLMLKVILYAYSQKVYSCRGIATMLHEDLPAIWLAAMQKPDFRTINHFRSVRMGAVIDQLFEFTVLELHRQGFVEFENYFLDGTKMEADANKYSFVFRKAVTGREAKLKIRIQETLQEIQEIAKAEGLELGQLAEEPAAVELASVANRLEDQVDILTDLIAEEKLVENRKGLRKRHSLLKKKVKLIRENFIPRQETYAEQLAVCGERNSFSKTDPDATFMRMKEDHMKNGQLKPGYNIQMATENQFVLFYTIHQRPGDARCLIPHLEELQASALPMPKTIVADAGYGSEENYLYLIGDEKEPLAGFLIPYGTYLKEQTKKFKNNEWNAKNWTYEEADDRFICPNGRRVVFKKYQEKKNASGFVQSYRIYECEDCTGCPLKESCTKAKGNRQVHWNPVYEELKMKAKEALECEDRKSVYARRKIEVETGFGDIKGNLAFRRFHLRGLQKVHIEFGLIAMAHNFRKVAGFLRSLSEKANFKKTGREQPIGYSLPVFNLGGFLDSPFRFNRRIRVLSGWRQSVSWHCSDPVRALGPQATGSRVSAVRD